ncbi:uncharacterized protein LOC115698496 [Cannabis sativa]|uniref:glutamate formimidoyltransferase n=1 Tax=Cannabis sativa TaxID=3483 RepID=A0A7J6HIF6_CANSA|nr:uncharacterized protein LOC115698496 [Cannabis sativa]KAF4394359.1 hypothetical protein G4B88_018509 [Cannabis sativa]
MGVMKKIMEDEEKWKKNKLICCRLFISESRNRKVLEAIERAGGGLLSKSNSRDEEEEAVIVNKLEDEAYNRVRYTIVSYCYYDVVKGRVCSPLRQTVMAMVEAAFEAINLETHLGAYPRLGVVDEILFHPLPNAQLHHAAMLAKAVALDVATKLQVPIYLYGAAHPTGKAIDIIRRELGYYTPNSPGNQWAGWTIPEVLPLKPNEGPMSISKERGISMIGARPWIGLYNIPIMTTDISVAQKIAKMVSEKGGGLPTVQTLGLIHGEDYAEIACMLLEPNRIGADQVQNRVEILGAQEGLQVKKGYYTDFSAEEIVKKYINIISTKKDSTQHNRVVKQRSRL